jgi:hypothetical protein
MVVAVNAVRRKDMGLKKAAKSFNIPRPALKIVLRKVSMILKKWCWDL